MPRIEEQARSLFLAALERPAECWEAYVIETCAGNPGLQARVEQLLREHQALGSIQLGQECGQDPTVERPSAAGRGTVIGPYKLLEPIGEGGMGEVWMAQQTEPIKRLVAIKLIKPGMDSKNVLARFEQERQALALMDHPNIAKVLDAGTVGVSSSGSGDESKDRLKPELQQGQPYFVMELVKGIPITNYCDEHRLTPRQRLELFLSTCQAIQHAHHKGIIHRDVKPNNVLVATYDDKPVPKIIDFGVAKATGNPLTEQTLHTSYGAVVGTFEYMSPEQASFNQLDVDTRSDVYSLGVLLYELLAGSPPFSRSELRCAGVLEMLRVIREQEPPKPSMRLSTAEGLPTLAANRGTEPGRLTKLVRGELDWIVMKALEKDRKHRYETANGLALDVQRYLADEPVLACPPSAGYRLKKVFHRNRAMVMAATIFILLLVGGVVGTSIGLVRAEHRAEGERQAKDSAKMRLAQVERGIKTLAAVFTDLDPLAEEKEGRPLRAILGDRLDKAAADLDGEAIGDPLLVASLQDRLGETFLGLGQPARAAALFIKAIAISEAQLGPDHLTTLGRMDHLAQAYREVGQIHEAVALSVRVWDTKTKILAADDPSIGNTLNDLAMAYRLIGEESKAIALLEKVREADTKHYGPDDYRTLSTLNNLAVVYLAVDREAEGIDLLEKVLEAKSRQFGAYHPHAIRAMNNLAGAYRAGYKMRPAFALFEKARDAAVPKLGLQHQTTLKILDNLAQMYRAFGELDKAIALGEHVRASRILVLGAQHPETLTTLDDLGLSYQSAGQLDKALALFQEVVVGAEKSKFAQVDAQDWVRHLCECHERRQQYEQAEVWRRKVLPLRKAKDGPHSPTYAKDLTGLASNLLKQKRFADAEQSLRECWAICQQTKPKSVATYAAQSLLGFVILQQQKYADAEPHLLESCRGLAEQNDSTSESHGSVTRKRRIEALERLVQLYDAWSKPVEGSKWRVELEALSRPP